MKEIRLKRSTSFRHKETSFRQCQLKIKDKTKKGNQKTRSSVRKYRDTNEWLTRWKWQIIGHRERVINKWATLLAVVTFKWVADAIFMKVPTLIASVTNFFFVNQNSKVGVLDDNLFCTYRLPIRNTSTFV